ncbi:DUF1115 domain protein [Cryphonectria parasitica EP155]|uniref:DUF1115 domain protein n=1 Tax=Cryphonectria parasitica (strain ATCC 38755 / EP155) TaxID=660469 RepID=A0A9P4XZ81_CRYP1|nr:DUF1115 domain protein [Cryphonectria parasitica EP155]KAF3763636.1 DUF1115 domain protein [Cryphonectria parasitica EP155]
MTELAEQTLPCDLVESQLAMVELIRAMYPPAEEDADYLTLQDTIDKTREWCETPEPSSTQSIPPDLSFMINIPIETSHETTLLWPSIQLKVTVPLRSKEKQITEPPPLLYTLRQPPWMSRAEVADLAAAMPADDVLAAFDYVKEYAPRYYLQKGEEATRNTQKPNEISNGPLLRVWFYFPSLSTREKRKDLVTYAPRYRLTGFVLAGKPGMLCLEGTSKDVDDYMNAIKNESWGDIPSHQKKVSERFREECGEGGRKFQDMTEITDELGEKRGARKNRGDMAALEMFLKERGVGESFSKVLMGA